MNSPSDVTHKALCYTHTHIDSPPQTHDNLTTYCSRQPPCTEGSKKGRSVSVRVALENSNKWFAPKNTPKEEEPSWFKRQRILYLIKIAKQHNLEFGPFLLTSTGLVTFLVFRGRHIRNLNVLKQYFYVVGLVIQPTVSYSCRSSAHTSMPLTAWLIDSSRARFSGF